MRYIKFRPRLSNIAEDPRTSVSSSRSSSLSTACSSPIALMESPRQSPLPRPRPAKARVLRSVSLPEKLGPIQLDTIIVSLSPTETTPKPQKSEQDEAAPGPESDSGPTEDQQHQNVIEDLPRISRGGKYGRTILHDAIRRGDVRAVRDLIAKNPLLLRQPDDRGNLPLHYAAHGSTKNAAAIISCLLQEGAFVNAVNVRRQTPLLIHVLTRDEDDDDLVTRLLLHHDARPAIKVSDSMYLPQFAKSRGLDNIAAALSEYM